MKSSCVKVQSVKDDQPKLTMTKVQAGTEQSPSGWVRQSKRREGKGGNGQPIQLQVDCTMLYYIRRQKQHYGGGRMILGMILGLLFKLFLLLDLNIHSYEYQVTSVDGPEYYGWNGTYNDFPGVYFLDDNVIGNDIIVEGDTVITIFNHDELIAVYKK